MKRIVCLMLACALLVPVCLAAPKNITETEKAQVLYELEIMRGTETGDLQLDRTITRGEFTKMIIAASQYRNAVGTSVATDPYPDVPRRHWAAPWVQMARDTDLVRGDVYGNFNPSNEITLAEGVTMILRLLGYNDNSNWPVTQMARYTTLGLDVDVTVKDSGALLTRRDTLHLFYNLLTTQNQSGMVYVSAAFGYGLNSFGGVDLDAIQAANRVGPILVTGNWKNEIPFDLNTAEMTRGGRIVTSVSEYDVLYYIESSRAVELYDTRVTGTLTAVLPGPNNPTSITVGGQTYALETREMIDAFSSRGPWNKGDTLTLLLGRTGGVAGVLSAAEYSEVVYGVVTAIGTGTALDSDGNDYTANTVTIFGTDGQSHSYVWDSDNVEVGDLASAQYGPTGPVVAKLAVTKTEGKLTLADDARVLDTYDEKTYGTVYPSRVAGLRYTGDMVRYYVTNSDGEVTDLILKDVTGDLHRYGVITEVNEINRSMQVSGSYTYDISGAAGVYTSSRVYGFKPGPFRLRSDGISLLSSISLTAPTGRTGYTLAERVLYYEKDADGNFTLSSAERLSSGGFTLTGWYDKPDSEGGRIRVVLGTAN